MIKHLLLLLFLSLPATLLAGPATKSISGSVARGLMEAMASTSLKIENFKGDYPIEVKDGDTFTIRADEVVCSSINAGAYAPDAWDSYWHCSAKDLPEEKFKNPIAFVKAIPSFVRVDASLAHVDYQINSIVCVTRASVKAGEARPQYTYQCDLSLPN